MPGTGDKLMTASEIKEVTDTKLVKDFSSLTALSGTPATGDLVPIKSGNNTYKIDYNALASAILGQISSNGVVNVANGGTGSNSATGALSGLIGALDTSSGFSLSDTIPVSINGTAYTITGRTLSNAIGGGGTEQSALTNYVKNCGTIASLPATIEDENITEDMVLLAYSLGTPSAMGSNWSVATDDGEIEITGTISGSTTLTLVFGVGFSVAPTILTDLSSTTPDNILKSSPRPGVTGTLPIASGGTGAASASAARTALDVYSKSETTSAISQSTAYTTGSVTPVGSGSSAQFMAVKQFGKAVSLYGAITGVAVGSNIKIGTISGVAAPATTVRTLCGVAANAYDHPQDVAYLAITTAGEIYVTSTQTGTKAVYFAITYIT